MMKYKILLSILLFNLTTAWGQIKFEKGYLIDNENHKTECFIRNYEWEKTPVECEYKLTENGAIKKGDVTSIKEFNIYGSSKYIRANIKIDRSLTEISDARNPVWNQEHLFLKVLVQGKASLYNYTEENSIKYFYSVNDSLIQQLVFKKYLDDNNHITANIRFRQQLLNDVNCSHASISTFQRIEYREEDLVKYFRENNKCSGDTFAIYDGKINKGKFNLRITPGINSSSFSMFVVSHYTPYKKIDFDHQISFRVGLEAEYLLPFYSNKFGILAEPAYQYFNAQKAFGNKVAVIDYKSLELITGIRYYFLLNDKARIFINGLVNTGSISDFNSHVDVPNDLDSSLMPLVLKARSAVGYGGGLNYKRLSFEVRYYSKQKIIDYDYGWSSDYQKVSFIIGYNLLGK